MQLAKPQSKGIFLNSANNAETQSERVVDKPPSVGQSEASDKLPSEPAFGRAHGDDGPTSGSPDRAFDVPVQSTTYKLRVLTKFFTGISGHILVLIISSNLSVVFSLDSPVVSGRPLNLRLDRREYCSVIYDK